MTTEWIIALLTGIGFGALAWRARRSVVMWGIAGAFLGLVVTTIVFGLGESAFVPFSNAEDRSFYRREFVVSIVVIVILGAILTHNLYLPGRSSNAKEQRPHEK